MEICDIVNSSSDAAKDAVKAIRKRLTQSAGKNYTVVMYTLTVLETCVKNCGKIFHVLVCNKEFISELVSLRISFTIMIYYDVYYQFYLVCEIIFSLGILLFFIDFNVSYVWQVLVQ